MPREEWVKKDSLLAHVGHAPFYDELELFGTAPSYRPARETSPCRSSDPRIRTKFNPDAAPDLLAALKQQLGLKLEPTRAPVDVMVIDKVKRPSEN